MSTKAFYLLKPDSPLAEALRLYEEALETANRQVLKNVRAFIRKHKLTWADPRQFVACSRWGQAPEFGGLVYKKGKNWDGKYRHDRETWKRNGDAFWPKAGTKAGKALKAELRECGAPLLGLRSLRPTAPGGDQIFVEGRHARISRPALYMATGSRNVYASLLYDEYQAEGPEVDAALAPMIQKRVTPFQFAQDWKGSL